MTSLALPKRNGKFILTRDASSEGIGAVLSQFQEGTERTVAFYSSLFKGAQSHYSTTEQELLAVVESLKHFRHYLAGRRFTLKIDHRALCYLWKSREQNNRLFRWLLRLQEFDFDVEYIRGPLNNSDVLSRTFSREPVSLIGAVSSEVSAGEELVVSLHRACGHAGLPCLRYHLLKRGLWTALRCEARIVVRSCEVCQRDSCLRLKRAVSLRLYL